MLVGLPPLLNTFFGAVAQFGRAPVLQAGGSWVRGPSAPPKFMEYNVMVNKFINFHLANPKVYNVIEKKAKEFRKLKPDGVIGIALIYNLMRWENAISTTGDVYKLRNDFMPFYARLIMNNNPKDLEGVFVIKKMFANSI